ncbi:type II toxin-antitoxin system VapC family toxin [Parafrigoribacterium soli]|uniref:type II toxin-antitoxin system VapC family toxin n=1 Tax=Parafrigoribacterium soli TaxID=3144663 RepID=UPI0032EFFAD0
MILVDTSVWIDHLHRSDPVLVGLLDGSSVLHHPMVLGELALGGLRNRAELVGSLAGLPSAERATHAEVMHLIESRQLYGDGLSLVGAYLLASVLLTEGALLWTRDKKLQAAARQLGIEFSPVVPTETSEAPVTP